MNNPDHAHILSGILRCPCCGKGMYGNVAKAHSKDNKTRYYYYCKNTVNATGHKCTFRTNIEQSQIDGMLERLISAMTREGKFKEAIQSKIGTTVDTSDMEKEMAVLSAKLHQAEAIKTRIEQQMDSLDVNTAHYEKKIADLQRRLDSQYDTIDETEQAIAEVRAQILDLKKSSISADSIYEFLLHFDEIYRECTDVERNKFMKSFVDRIELYPERRKDGNWIKNILFNFSIPVVREDEELARIGGISLENSTLSNVDLPLDNSPTHEACVLLSKTSEEKSEIRDAAVPASAERESGISYPCFKVVEFDHFKSEAGLPTFTMSVSDWIEKTEGGNRDFYKNKVDMEAHLFTKISQVEQKRLESE